MNAALRVDRLFSLSNTYNNIKFSEEISEIPEKVLLSKNGVSLLYSLMLLEVEKAYRNYILLYKKLPASMEQLDKAAEIIEEERTRTYKEFLEEFNKEQ